MILLVLGYDANKDVMHRSQVFEIVYISIAEVIDYAFDIVL